MIRVIRIILHAIVYYNLPETKKINVAGFAVAEPANHVPLIKTIRLRLHQHTGYEESHHED